jgi:uncharacterized protein (TIGR02145 family)
MQQKKACPKGWRLPTKPDFEDLIKYCKDNYGDVYEALIVGGKSGFNAHIAGASYGKFYQASDTFGMFWSSTPDGNSSSYLMVVHAIEKDVALMSTIDSTCVSVRCVKG